MLDENLIFIILIIVFLVFIIKKQPELIAISILVYLAYIFYKSKFINPRDFLLWLKNKTFEPFQSCTNENQIYCGNSNNSNLSFLPPYLRSMPVSNNSTKSEIKLNPEKYQIDKRFNLGTNTEININDMINNIPMLLDYKLYLEKLIKFTLGIQINDNLQKDFLATKIQYKMTKIFYNAYNIVNEQIYPMQSYNELLLAERELDDTINIFVFLGLNDIDNSNLSQLQKEFEELNKKLNQYIIDKINQVDPNNYNIYYSKLPEIYEPLGANSIL